MTPESSSKWKLSQFMSYHILCDKDWYVNLTIMNSKSMPNKLWNYSTIPRPRLNNRFFTIRI